MKEISLEKLKAMTPEQRGNLYQNAAKRREFGGQAIIDLIDGAGLSISSGGMRSDDPVYLRMEEIIWSTEGRTAAIGAVENKLPALAGVDPLISANLGERYNPHDGGTTNAGYILAALMRHLGYLEDGIGNCPDDCVAKTGLKWKLRR